MASIKKWSRHFERCKECGCTDTKHQAFGLCDNCYNRERYAREKGTVLDVFFASVVKPPDWGRVRQLETESSGYLGFLEIETYERFCDWQDRNRTNKEVNNGTTI